jgi:hypothetical protein
MTMGNRFYSTPLSDRFWAKVEKTDGCWLWTGCRDKRGYGQINRGAHSGHLKTHRVSWEMHYGPIPDGLSVLHKCDNHLVRHSRPELEPRRLTQRLQTRQLLARGGGPVQASPMLFE